MVYFIFFRAKAPIINKVKGKMSLKVNNIQLQIAVPLDPSTLKFGELAEFEIDSKALYIDNIDLHFSFNPMGILDALLKWVANALKEVFVPYIGVEVRKMVNTLIANKTLDEIIKGTS